MATEQRGNRSARHEPLRDNPSGAESRGARAKGERRRQSLVEAAADIIVSEGPQAISHRAVAARAGSSLSATTYYFDSLDDLIGAAGKLLMGCWAARAERVADHCESTAPHHDPSTTAAGLVLDALLPPAGAVRGHYQQLLVAGAEPRLAQAYRAGRHRLDVAVARILKATGSPCSAALAIAVVDGAVVTALSEGRDVTKTATALLRRVL